MHVEIDDLTELDRHLTATGSLDGTVVQGLDLRAHADRLADVTAAGAVLLGVDLDEATCGHLVATGAVVVPRLPDLPYDPFRPALYTIEELLGGLRRGVEGSFAADTVDSRIYEHTRAVAPQGTHVGLPVVEALAQRLHDHAVDDAVGDLLSHHPDVVGVMGGHSLHRDDPVYRTVAEVGRALARAGLLVATGGGPGAMEAANLGAWLAGRPDAALDESLALLAAENDYREADVYLDVALAVRDRFGEDETAVSLAVPTWFYGHEPTNVFATHVAKYFANSIREDGLLAIASRGVIFAPGSAGTTQEIFQDATQNHYRVFDDLSPMVLLDTAHWNDRLPAAPLLTALAASAEEPWAQMITVTDDTDEAVRAILEPPG
ncbi:MAG: hypothetical protein AAFZ07_03185 [Actinomycetota bacterium]